MSPSSPHAAPHGVTLTLRLVALPTLCGVASNGLLVATTLYGESIPPFRKSQKNFSAFRRHYSSWPPTVGASGEFRYIYRSSSLSDNVQPSSLTPRHSDPSPPAWPQRRRRGIVHVTVAYFEMVRWNRWVDVRCSHHHPVYLVLSVRFPDPPFLVSAIFLTTLSVRRLSLEALGVLLRAFPSAVAAARPSSLSDLRPTAVYGWTVSVGTEAAQCNAEMPCASDHLIVSDIFDRGCTIFAFKTTSDIRSVPIDLLNVPCAQCDRIVPMPHVRPSQNSMTMGSDSDLRPGGNNVDRRDLSRYLNLQARMNPSGSDDDECLSVQLDGSDMAPNAAKTVLRQRFPMRRYYLEPDGRLSNSAKVMDGNTLNTDTTHTMTQSILAFLHPHTSSPSTPLVARTMTSLMAGDFGEEELNQILNTQLDSLAISPQAKHNIIPGLLGIAKLAARVQSQGFWLCISAPSSALLSHSILPEPEPEFIHTTSGTSYQMRQRPFSSQSGSGYTIWYFSRSNLSILTPPTVPQVKTGHLYVHLDASRDVFQYWIFTNRWERVQSGAEYPLNHDRILAVRANGEPSWVTRASTVTTKTRKEKEKEVREQSVQG
ncbi:hypothetical protein EDB85DRAFT_1899040 [Lactarius pseudohatsudake]|nr:hypothetical protein EDB85DRAFT_1899040 [Lactarius pseudohatsudake]